jgi:hypothetical protein
MKSSMIVAVVAAVTVLSVSVGFGAFNKEIPDNGKHFNLNIIGVPKNKTADMDGTQGNTIFVPLNKNGEVAHCVINVQRNIANPNKFEVIDRNATDEDGATILVPFENEGDLSYNVYAISLGKPGDVGVYIEASATFVNDTTADLLMTNFTLKRDRGKPTVQNISNIFRASGWIDENDNDTQDAGDTTFNNVWVFNIPTLLSYWWDYYNTDLRHMQVRFYETTSGEWGTVE